MIANELLPEFNCVTCTKNQKNVRGCETDAPHPRMRLDEEELFRCIRRPILEGSAYFSQLFRLYRAYRAGNLPEDGGFLSQPARLVTLFTVMDNAIAYCEEERQRKEAARKRRAMRGG